MWRSFLPMQRHRILFIRCHGSNRDGTGTGDVFHGHVAGIAEGMRYGLRGARPFLPGDGHHVDGFRCDLARRSRGRIRPSRW